MATEQGEPIFSHFLFVDHHCANIQGEKEGFLYLFFQKRAKDFLKTWLLKKFITGAQCLI